MSSEKFQNKYRIPSNRLKNWDYGSNAAYFITICTQNREHFFGEITNGVMHLNELGKIATQFWSEIPNHFPFVELGNFVIMPNHTHGILIINKTGNLNVSLDGTGGTVDTPKLGVSTSSTVTTTNNINELPKPKNGGKNDQWKPGTIGVIINQFKRVVTIHSRKINQNFAWQSRYHDHIIRNSASFENIQKYIEENPSRWKDDKFYETE
jgi:putative transposase